jgi:hypothetical protein
MNDEVLRQASGDREFQGSLVSTLRKKLNLQTYKSHGVYVVPLTERPKIELLCKRYGVNVITDPSLEEREGDVGTSGTS